MSERASVDDVLVPLLVPGRTEEDVVLDATLLKEGILSTVRDVEGEAVDDVS